MPQLLSRYIGGKTVEFIWNQPFGRTELRISLPSLEDCKYSVWGDWGPMYTFVLEPDRQILIGSRRGPQSSDYRYAKLDTATIELNSPAEAEVRRELPFYYIVKHPTENVIFEIYLDRHGEPRLVKVISAASGSPLDQIKVA